MRGPFAGAAAMAAGALTVAACSTSTSGGGTGSGSPSAPASIASASSIPTPPSSSPAVTSAAPVTSGAPATITSTSASAAAAGGLTQQQAQAALLTATDVGPGFAQTTSSDSAEPLPCTPNDPPLDKQFSPTAKALIDFAGTGDQAELSQEITVYSDAATAERALAAGEKGLACSSAQIGSPKVPVTITGPADLTTAVKVKVDKCEGWSVAAKGVNISLIVARVGQQLVVLTFSAQSGIDTSKLPDARGVTERALTKVKAAL